MSRENEVIKKAKRAIANLGWLTDEDIVDGNKCHLVLTRGTDRTGWGVFDRLYCWTEAFEYLTGKNWITLLNE